MNRRGFTIVEIVVTIGILVIVAALSLPLYGNWQIDNQAESTKNSIEQLLFLARSRAQAGFHDSKHGVYIDDSEKTAVYYAGNNYASRDTEYDRAIDYPSCITISSSIAGGELVFALGSGEPNATGTINFTSISPAKSYTISINEVGLIE